MLHNAYIKFTAPLEYLAVGQNQFFPRSTTVKRKYFGIKFLNYVTLLGIHNMTVYLRKGTQHAAQDVTTIYAVVKRSHHVYGQLSFSS